MRDSGFRTARCSSGGANVDDANNAAIHDNSESPVSSGRLAPALLFDTQSPTDEMPNVTQSADLRRFPRERERASAAVDSRLFRRGERAPETEAPFSSRLWMRSRGHVQIIEVDEIEWIQSDLRYCRVYLRSGEVRRVREPIGSIERRLDPERFARVHRSVIVNLERVAQAISSAREKAVVLKSGTRLPMSRSGRHRLLGSSDSSR
jgi:DNA-binding LytR/AlgR family response regulator